MRFNQRSQDQAKKVPVFPCTGTFIINAVQNPEKSHAQLLSGLGLAKGISECNRQVENRMIL